MVATHLISSMVHRTDSLLGLFRRLCVTIQYGEGLAAQVLARPLPGPWDARWLHAQVRRHLTRDHVKVNFRVCPW